MYAKTTAWNKKQKRDRLVHEIARFKARVAACANPGTPQQKRALTRAVNCLRDRERQLARI